MGVCSCNSQGKKPLKSQESLLMDCYQSPVIQLTQKQMLWHTVGVVEPANSTGLRCSYKSVSLVPRLPSSGDQNPISWHCHTPIHAARKSCDIKKLPRQILQRELAHWAAANLSWSQEFWLQPGLPLAQSLWSGWSGWTRLQVSPPG